MAKTGDSSFPRDLLQRFTCGGHRLPVKPKEEAHGRPEKVELSLGLSLNGRFGMESQKLVVNDDKNDNKLFRASSVTDFVNIPVDVELSLYSPLTRTCSLPPETEAEWRKRKELQSFRRSEAKRKRVEKLKNVRVVNRRNLVNGIESMGRGLKQSPPSPAPILSQVSIGSQGSGGSSGVSDLDSQPFQVTNKDASETHEQSKPKTQLKAHYIDHHMMPCVSTKGDGPDGKKIQGFLYRYGKGENVRIVCVCHGSFLTPAEFVKHGGGGEVEHPLRHIIVDSSSVS
ncbi:ninja-family protein AFP3-like [Cynara cardunculus var. scolymus]|uniref:Ninja-family protein n=1 Tax=Cynara cardunculus var. scolymus TaxID=59895 RepID=A0A118JUU3_CYNCS|nr:ninja-family protein AFP3-like [Cynara cardunculus var. scolymus]KVH92651.1 Protein of unknown function DUF1675 [Cynara cardunculus var. scolymus]